MLQAIVFCTTRRDLTPQTMLEACGYPEREQLLATLAKHGQAKPNDKSITMYREGLCGVWDRWFAKG